MTEDRYFDEIPTAILCRMGGNGPDHPSQFKGLELVKPGSTLLDVGCGSATTTECIDKNFADKIKRYKGVDAVKQHVDWCKENFPKHEFEVQHALHLDEKDNSWDTVWSRHVVDHLESFEKAMEEHMRVARKQVICILWYGLSIGNKHDIKHVKYDKEYGDEYLNSYSISEIINFLFPKYNQGKDGWVFDIYFKVGRPQKAHDTIINIYKDEARNC